MASMRFSNPDEEHKKYNEEADRIAKEQNIETSAQDVKDKKKEEINRLKEEVSELERQTKTLKQRADEQRVELSTKGQALDEHRAELLAKGQSLDECNEKVRVQQTELEEKNVLIDSMKVEIEGLKEETERLKKEIDKRETKLLAKEFEEIAEEYRSSSNIWLGVTILGFILLLVLAGILYNDVTNNNDFNIYASISKFIFITVAITISGFIAKQYSLYRNLSIDMRHRKNLAQTYHNLLRSENEATEVRASLGVEIVKFLASPPHTKENSEGGGFLNNMIKSKQDN